MATFKNFDPGTSFFNQTKNVTPSDTVPFPASWVRVGDITTVGAVIKWDDAYGNTITGFVIGSVGEYLPSQCTKVYATGTTAAAITRSLD